MRTVLLVIAIIGLTIAAAACGWQLSHRWYDPLFGLKDFPTSEYLRDYAPLVGRDFQCRWSYLDEVGRRDGVRVAVFRAANPGQPVTVALPEELTGGLNLPKNKVFSMKVTVVPNGLIYAKACQ